MSFSYSLVPEAAFGGGSLVAGLLVVIGFLLGLGGVRRRVRRLRHVRERVLVLGQSALGRSVIEEIERQPALRYVIVGVVNDAENLGRVIQETRPDRIVVALAERRGRLPLHPLIESLAHGIVVEDVVETYERLTGKLALEALSPSSVVFSGQFRTSRLQQTLSRTLSLVGSVIGLVVLAPLLGLIVLLIKLDSRGPAFFVQARVGKRGRSFRLLKFRTMHPTHRPKSEWEQDNGDRITRVGRWLRRFRLDEVPQFVNILRGDMNLVGPRPHPASNFELFVLVSRNASESGAPIPYYSFRSMVRPGITGWAQVRYRYANDLEEEIEKLRYDLYYIKYLSIWLDLRILFETVKIVLFGHEMREDGARTIAADMRAVTHQVTTPDSVQADLSAPAKWQPSPQNWYAVERAWAETLPLTQA